MRWRTSSRMRAISMLTVVMLSAPRMATAQCDGPKRPPTAAEAKAYAFSRTFNRSQTEMQARGDAALKKTEAVRARGDARNKAKEAKLADLDRRQADLAKRIETAAGQQNFAALAAISEESNKLAAEREALVTDSVAETEMTVVVLPPVAGVPGQTVLRISGDPARADALLKATTLRECPPRQSFLVFRFSRGFRPLASCVGFCRRR